MSARGLWARYVPPDLDEPVHAMLQTVLVTGQAAQVELRAALTGEQTIKPDVGRLGLPKERFVEVLLRDATPNASTESKG